MGPGPADDTPIVRLRGVGKVFASRDGGRTAALDGVDLDVRPGEFVSFIGPSGCGKSTLLRVVADLVRPTTGEVAVNGKSAGRARLDHDYGFVFQAPGLFDWRTVLGNVELPLEILGVDAPVRRRRARETLALVGLADVEGRMPYELSGGMQQRVSIARALSFEPRLLLMDEPFGALDEMTRERLNAELGRIWAQTGITVLFVTHSIPEAVALSTRVTVMAARPGRIAATVDIDLPVPRDGAVRESETFFRAVTTLRAALREDAAQPDGDPADGAPAESAGVRPRRTG